MKNIYKLFLIFAVLTISPKDLYAATSPYFIDFTKVLNQSVAGKEAQNFFPQFYKSIKETNFDINKIEFFKYFDTKRWDIFLKSGRLIKLPSNEKDTKQSILKFMSISKDKKFDKFKIFDFRVKNQLIIK